MPSLLKQGALIIDVRTNEEFISGNINGSINIPLGLLNEKINELDNTKPIILCCASGSRSSLARRVLKAKGFESVHNAGTWSSLLKF